MNQEQLQSVFTYIDDHEEEMIRLLQNLVEMESPSADFERVAKTASHLHTYCDAVGMHAELQTFEQGGPCLTAWTQPGNLPPVAMLGHMDTVHPVGSFGPHPYTRDGDIARGPGIFDMKGGDVIALFAIRALMHTGYKKRQLKLILTGDEEVAHAYTNGDGGAVAEAFTNDCAAVFNCESGQPDAEVTIRRKGGAIFIIRVYGKAAHAGKEPQKGASAIRQAAEMICEIERHTEFSSVTYNCGKISGGKGSNIIPDYCEFNIGLRYVTNEQYEQAAEMIKDLCDHPVVAGTHCEMSQNGFYPAMEPVEKTEALLNVYREACRIQGYPEPQGVSQGGCSDSAFVTRHGIPAI